MTEGMLYSKLVYTDDIYYGFLCWTSTGLSGLIQRKPGLYQRAHAKEPRSEQKERRQGVESTDQARVESCLARSIMGPEMVETGGLPLIHATSWWHTTFLGQMLRCPENKELDDAKGVSPVSHLISRPCCCNDRLQAHGRIGIVQLDEAVTIRHRRRISRSASSNERREKRSGI